MIDRLVPEQADPLKFFGLLQWIDDRSLLAVMEPYRQAILREALFTLRSDGSPQYKRVLTGRAKKNSKTTDAVLAALYKLLAWKAAGRKGNQVFFVASDLGQANDALDLCKKLIAVNPVLSRELQVYRNVVRRIDGEGFCEILPAGDAEGLHGKTYLFYVHSELHTQRDYRVLQALELDRTRPDASQWFESYASVSPAPGMPINDLLKQHSSQSDPRLYVSWYAGSVEEANPSLNGPLGPKTEDIQDAERSLPSWVFRRLYQNLPGQPDSAAFDAGKVEAAIVRGRTALPPEAGLTYLAGCDLSGGGADDATLSICHVQGGRIVQDCLVDQGSRHAGRTFDPQHTIERFASVLREYRCTLVTGDRYAAQWPIQAFAKVGITYRPAELNRSQIYAAFEPLLNSAQVELLDHPKLFPQLIGLIRKGERIDHGAGDHDDHSNSTALACVLAAKVASMRPLGFTCGGVSISGDLTEAVTGVQVAPGVIVPQLSEDVLALAQQVRVIRQRPMCVWTAEEMLLVQRFVEGGLGTGNAVERAVLARGAFFPGEQGHMSPGEHRWQETVKEKFSRW